MRALVRPCRRRAAADPGRPAAVPCLRHDGDDELGPVRGRGDDPAAALQAGGAPAHHRAQEADGHGRRADLVQRHAERAGSRRATISARCYYCVSGGAALPRSCASPSRRRPAPSCWRAMASARPRRSICCNPVDPRAEAAAAGSVGLPYPADRDLDPRHRSAAPAPGRRARPARSALPAPRSWRAIGSGPEETRTCIAGWRARHGRCRPYGRRGLCLHHRPPQGHDQRQRLQGLSAQYRGGGADPSRGAGMRRGRHARSLSRRDGEGSSSP